MKLPEKYVPDLDHRITVLISFTVRRELGYFGPDHGESKAMGDIFRSAQEASGIMLRLLLEFLGVKPAYDKKTWTPLGLMATSGADTRLGSGALSGIPPVDISKLSSGDGLRLATLHDEVSKRTGHPAFEKISDGMDPKELSWASEWIVRQLWERCYDPDPITAHRDIVALLPGSQWRGIPFRSS